MSKYTNEKIGDHYLYFTTSCLQEPMHVHASNRSLTEAGSAKLFVMYDGDTIVQNRGTLTNRQLNQIKKYIKAH